MKFVWIVVLALLAGCQSSIRSGAPGPRDPDAPTELTTTDSGLKYRILRRGGEEKPGPSSFVSVDYVGTLDDGREFDSSYSSREPVKFNLENVIPGWTEGLQLVGEGGMIELQIPPQLGYGENGVPGTIPPNSTLNFIVELRDVR